ncbi:MAG: amino acid permease [Gemmatimonadetes bacterium]|nr:amino acid permease [Gemmatimonadota bacterium]
MSDPTRSAELQRSLGPVQASALVVGIIIGASIFVQPSEIVREVPSIPGIFLVWTAAGLLTVVGALLCAELASAYPETGGVYVFLRRTLSPAVAFLWGWAMFWSMHSGIIAAISVVFARYLSYFLPTGDTGIRLIATLAILAVSAINYLGVRHGARLQAAFSIGKVLAIAVVILVAFALGPRAPLPSPSEATSPPPPPADLAAFVRAIAAGLFAFGGWHMVTYTAGETVGARRTIPRALAIGIGVVILCYLALNAAYLYVLPLDAVVGSVRVAADAADAVLGSGGAAVLSALVVFSSFGALAGLVLAGPRVYHAMAGDGLLFRWAGAVHPRFRTPHRAIALQAVWSCVLVATGSYRALFTRVIYTEWIFFALLAVGLMLARRRPDYAPTVRMPGVPLVPALFVAGALTVVAVAVASAPADSVVGLLLVLAGWPVYILWAGRAGTREEARAYDRLP